MVIALVSLNQVWENKDANQIKCKYYIEFASKHNCELIIFPEMTLTGFSMNTKLIREKQNHSPTIKFFSQQAYKYKIHIGFGVVFEKDEKATNNFVVIDNEGNLVSCYTKIHPFSFSGENKFYFAGDKLVTCNIADVSIGLSVCYDLRFPEIFQALSQNSNIIITIANWPKKRILHWKVLLQARAIENQSFMIGVNRIGIDGNDTHYSKSSFIFDPSGEKMKPISSYNELDIFNLELTDSSTIRSLFPVKQDRKIKFYKSIL